MARIINFDETCCSLDGGAGIRGGRPEVMFYNPNLPQLGIKTSKTALTTTLITGSSAAGEAIPPHFQFPTTAKDEDLQKLRMEIATYAPDILCKFGMAEATYLGISFGMNEKGGMDEVEFEKYVMNSIVPLYPDSDDVPGKRVMAKVDSGPGRLNARLVARLRLLGFYLYPGVPNTTGVSQETDRNYGPFKGQYRNNLSAMVDQRIRAKKSVSLQPCLVSIPVFGAVDPETNIKVGDCAFTKGFSRKACLSAWEKVGAAFNNTCTRKCLSDPKVMISFGDGSDDYLNSIQMGNDLAVYALNDGGYNGDLLKGRIQETKAPEILTRPQSMERVKLLSEASSHGAKFAVTGGSHIMTNDFIMAACLKEREHQLAVLMKDKKARVQKFTVQQKALAILALKSLESQAISEYSNLTAAELDVLIRYHGAIPKGGKQEKMAKWKAICNKGKKPACCLPWTEPEDAVPLKLQTEEMTMGDTHLGQ
jgi:hypothetical protein